MASFKLVKNLMIKKEMNTLRLLLLLKETKSIFFKLYNQKRYVFYKLLKSLRRKRKYAVISTDTLFYFYNFTFPLFIQATRPVF